MACPLTPKRLSSPTAAYIAGLVDGEGTITLTVQHRGENRRLVVSISNTELPLLEYVRQQVGVGRITSKRTYSSKHSPSYTYVVTSRQALALLSQLAPYLRTYKVRRARLALYNYIKLTPRNGKYTPAAKRARLRFEHKLLAERPIRSH